MYDFMLLTLRGTAVFLIMFFSIGLGVIFCIVFSELVTSDLWRSGIKVRLISLVLFAIIVSVLFGAWLAAIFIGLPYVFPN